MRRVAKVPAPGVALAGLVAGLGLVAALGIGAAPAAAQSALDRSPNVDGTWVSEAGMLHFHTVHRFWLTERSAPDAPRFLVNHPTIQLAAGLGHGVLAGVKYVSNSRMAANEWEGYARWRPLTEAGSGLADVSVTGAWNGGAESVDGEVALSRSLGPARVHAVARGFSAFQGGGPGAAAGAGAAVGAGASWRLRPNVAVAGDVVVPVTADATLAWSVGLQLRIPYTPHTLSVHATNAYATTLHASSFGGGQLTYGFEFTVPLTLSRYLGGREGSAAAEPAAPAAPAAGDTAVVGMDNRLRFLPDTIRVRVGQAVRWENGSAVVHTVTADPAMAALASSVSLPDGASTFDSGDIVPGATYTRVFTVPGTYVYFCIPHERLGMVGTVIVEER